MDTIVSLPLFFRLIAVFLCGGVIGLFIPRFTRFYSTCAPEIQAERAKNLFTKIFPLLVAVAFLALYCWEIFLGGTAFGNRLLPLRFEPDSLETLHWRFLVHGTLFAFLLVATYIDFEEMIIPDSITIPGTILGLLLAAWIPQGLLPAMELIEKNGYFDFAPKSVSLHLASSQTWPNSLAASPNVLSLVLALGIWWFWCFAMLHRVWYFRLPFRKASAIFLRYLRHSPSTPLVAALAVLGSVAISWFWLRAAPGTPLHWHGFSWQGFFSALVGMFGGMAVIWSVRIAGFLALRREAMGFGDVTFMGMIGAFLGWQPCILIFFLAPLAGLAVGIVRFLLSRERELPYGPYLSIATVLMLVFWPECWGATEIFFSCGWLIPIVMAVCVVLLGVMLKGWVILRERLQNRPRGKKKKKKRKNS